MTQRNTMFDLDAVADMQFKTQALMVAYSNSKGTSVESVMRLESNDFYAMLRSAYNPVMQEGAGIVEVDADNQ